MILMQRSQIATSFLPSPGTAPAEWLVQPGLTPYEQALAFMEARAGAIRDGTANELIWLVEHPPLYTAGTSAQDKDLVDANRFPGVQRRTRWRIHLSWTRAARSLCDARPETPP